MATGLDGDVGDVWNDLRYAVIEWLWPWVKWILRWLKYQIFWFSIKVLKFKYEDPFPTWKEIKEQYQKKDHPEPPDPAFEDGIAEALGEEPEDDTELEENATDILNILRADVARQMAERVDEEIQKISDRIDAQEEGLSPEQQEQDFTLTDSPAAILGAGLSTAINLHFAPSGVFFTPWDGHGGRTRHQAIMIENAEKNMIEIPGWFLDMIDSGTTLDTGFYRTILEDPQKLDIDFIKNSPNVEIRALMIKIYGFGRYVKDIGAYKLCSDDFGTLWTVIHQGREAEMYVEVVNATAERDGTFKNYFLRVPPNMRTPKEAVAWTFGERPENYNPEIES